MGLKWQQYARPGMCGVLGIVVQAARLYSTRRLDAGHLHHEPETEC